MKRDYPHVIKATAYASAIVSGAIPACRYVRLACQRHLDDLESAKSKSYPYRLDPAKAERVCRFIEKMPHIKGKWASGSGSAITLQPWQCFILSCVFGWTRVKDGSRRYREAYIEVPRKNGKSVTAAGVGLYMLAADAEPGAEVYAGATSEKQAWEVFKPARLMALKADGFREHFGVQVNASNIAILDTASKFEPVIGNPGDGSSPHCAIVDEFHEHSKPELYDTMITGMGARSQPLMFVITTAGTDLSGPCYDKRDQVVKILTGVLENPEVFGIIYTLDDEDDWTDFENWTKANPNYGVSIDEDYLKSRHIEAMQRVSRQNIIRCKHLNQWMNADVGYFDVMAWAKCADPTMKRADFNGQPCVIFIDLASRKDIAAMMLVFREDGEDGKTRYAVFGNYYLPEDEAEYGSGSHYQAWAKEGWLTLTPGNSTDFGYIKDDLLDLKSTYEIAEVAYDPFQATMFATECMAEGFPMVEYGMTVRNFSEPMKELDALIRDGRIRHNGDPVLTWMISNVTAHMDKKENVFPNKDRPENKIDGAVGLIGAVGRWMMKENTVTVGIELW